MANKRIFIVDNHSSFRAVMEVLIAREEGLESCGAAESAEAAIDLILETKPDLVIIDLSLPGISGTELITRLKEQHCRSNSVILSGHCECEYAAAAIAAGSVGYIVKSDAGEIIEGIRHAVTGDRYVSPEVRFRS